ncbi:MAG: hypothetical protein ACMG55_07570 [Microcoleus sp.]
MLQKTFIRNVRADGLLELFLVSAITGLLAVRFYLYTNGYPQIGGDLHIAHMLWGGALMLAALISSFSFIGYRSLRLSAFVGGIGFGIFIDELGKFITKDNNYFYQPTVGIIYAIFIVLFILFRFIAERNNTLTSREYVINAIVQLEEAALHDMDTTEKQKVQSLLRHADKNDPVTKALQRLMADVVIRDTQPTLIRKVGDKISDYYRHFITNKHAATTVRWFFGLQSFILVAGMLLNSYSAIQQFISAGFGQLDVSLLFLMAQAVSIAVSIGFIIWGMFELRTSRLRAYGQFHRATLNALFLTEFFAFYRLQFRALPGFIFNLVILGIIVFLTQQERKVQRQAIHKATI